MIGVAVDAAVLVAAHAEIVLENVEHARHLRKDQAPRALRFQTLQELVKNDQFTTIIEFRYNYHTSSERGEIPSSDEVLAFDIRRSRLSAREEVGMVDALAELHQNVRKPRLGPTRHVDRIQILAQHLLVPNCNSLEPGHILYSSNNSLCTK